MYCGRKYQIRCAECSLRNYGRDCHNNCIGAGGASWKRCQTEDVEHQADGKTADQYGNAYATFAQAQEFFN